MLAKRKMEEQEAYERERASAIETDQDEEALGPHKASQTQREDVRVEKVSDVTSAPTETAPPARPVGGREQSSLRVGRVRTSRNHIARPVSKPRNRFSAAFDEDEGDDAMLDDVREQKAAEEPKKLPTLFESPKGFTFAQEVGYSLRMPRREYSISIRRSRLRPRMQAVRKSLRSPHCHSPSQSPARKVLLHRRLPLPRSHLPSPLRACSRLSRLPLRKRRKEVQLQPGLQPLPLRCSRLLPPSRSSLRVRHRLNRRLHQPAVRHLFRTSSRTRLSSQNLVSTLHRHLLLPRS